MTRLTFIPQCRVHRVHLPVHWAIPDCHLLLSLIDSCFFCWAAQRCVYRSQESYARGAIILEPWKILLNPFTTTFLRLQRLKRCKKIDFALKKRAFFAWQNCIFLKIKKIVLHPMQKHIPNTRIKFEVDRLISFRVTTAAILKNAVLRKTRLKFWLLIFTL